MSRGIGGRSFWDETRAPCVPPPPCSPTPTSLLPDSLRIFLALMMCPVKSRNGNNLRARKQSRRGVPRCSGAPFFSPIVICRGRDRGRMRADGHLVFCVMVVLTGSSQTIGQSSALPPALLTPAGSSASPDLTEDPGNEVRQRTRNPAGGDETLTPTLTSSKTEGTVHSEAATDDVYKTRLLTTSSAVASSPHTNVTVAMTPSASAAADGLSSTPTAQSTTTLQHLYTAEGTALLTRDPLTAFSSQPAHTMQDARSTAHASTVQPHSESLNTATTQTTTTGHPLTSAPGRGPAVPTHWEVPSELNVGDEDLKRPHYRSSSPLDPLLAGLLSVFIVTTAIVFVVLFLRFRQRTNHPEFHRLQDLPMDDLMEDTPLSRYTH